MYRQPVRRVPWTSVQRRIFGIENEYGVTCTLRGPAPSVARRGRSVPVPAGRQLGSLLERVPRERCPALSRRRQPPRVRHAGVRQPLRRRRPRQGGRADPRGPAALGRASGSRRKASAGQIYLFKNNTDSAGNSYGCHENYLVGRQGDFQRIIDTLIPFFVTRQIFAGAGKLLQTARGTVFCLAQRAEHIWEGHLVGDHPEPTDHQHPRRAACRRRAVSTSPRDRRRLEHVRVHDRT